MPVSAHILQRRALFPYWTFWIEGSLCYGCSSIWIETNWWTQSSLVIGEWSECRRTLRRFPEVFCQRVSVKRRLIELLLHCSDSHADFYSDMKSMPSVFAPVLWWISRGSLTMMQQVMATLFSPLKVSKWYSTKITVIVCYLFFRTLRSDQYCSICIRWRRIWTYTASISSKLCDNREEQIILIYSCRTVRLKNTHIGDVWSFFFVHSKCSIHPVRINTCSAKMMFFLTLLYLFN